MNAHAINSTPVPFDYEGSPIRTVTIDGEPWFCATDVCAILGYANAPDAVKKHCRADAIAKRASVDAMGRAQEVQFISEGNLYRLIVKSRKAEAEQFERWVMETVLPTVRRTGVFIPAGKDPMIAQLEYLIEAREHAIQMDNRLTLVENRINQAAENVMALPAPTLEVVQSTAELCRLAIQNLASLTGKNFNDLWHEAYRQYDVATKTCVTKRMNGSKLSKLIWVEANGNIETLYAIIMKMVDKAKA